MRNNVAKMFKPDLTLVRRRGNRSQWYPDKIHDGELLRQFIDEAGLPKNGINIDDSEYDTILAVAGNYGVTVETIGE